MVRPVGVLVACAAALAAGPAFGQYRGFGSMQLYNNPGSAMLDTMIWNRLHQQAMERDLARKRGGPANRGAETPPAGRAEAGSGQTASASTTFKPGTGDAAERKLAGMLADKADDRAQLAEALLQVWNAYSKQAAAQGYKNDTGHAMGFCVAALWQTCRQKEVPSAAVPALTKQMRAILLATDRFSATTDRQREAFARTLVELGALCAMGHQAAGNKGDEKTAANFAQGARGLLKGLLGVDADRIEITEEGMTTKP